MVTILGENISLIKPRAYYAQNRIKGIWKEPAPSKPATTCTRCGKLFNDKPRLSVCGTCEMVLILQSLI